MPPAVHLVGSHGASSMAASPTTIDEALLDRHRRSDGDRRGPARRDRRAETGQRRAARAQCRRRRRQAALAAARAAGDGVGRRTDRGQGGTRVRGHLDRQGRGRRHHARPQYGATAVVFFGDDVTDEKAFRRMREATSA